MRYVLSLQPSEKILNEIKDEEQETARLEYEIEIAMLRLARIKGDAYVTQFVKKFPLAF